MELKYSKQKQLGKKKGKEKQSYIKFLNLYKSTNRLPEGMTKETTNKLYSYIDREVELLWKALCWRKWGKALDGGEIDKKYYNVKLEQPWQIHHLIGRGHHLTRWSVENGIIITSGVHDHLTNHDPQRFSSWLKEKFPERYEWREKNLISAYSFHEKPTIQDMLDLKNKMLS